MFLYLNFFKKILVGLLIFILVAGPFGAVSVRTANAQGLTVPIGTDFDFHSIMGHLKDFTLDRLAVMVANQILQRMTASVVDWINRGFDGSPAFLTNPEGFFLDIADNVAGQFIHEIGASGLLCSPFGLDLQIALALNRVNLLTPQYQCTLTAAIRNAEDSLNNNFNVNVNVYNQDQFLLGDFEHGGWRAFNALAMEPQNNPNSAFLTAQADISARVAGRQIPIVQDLNRGMGFMSWQKCETVSGNIEGHDPYTMQQYGINDSQVGELNKTGNRVVHLNNGSSLRKRVDANTNSVTYENCSTQTPGSIIGGSLQRQLDVPADKLVLVKTISDSIDAILGALVNQMLNQGLAALSKPQNDGSGKSYLKKLVDEANSSESQLARNTRQRILNETNSIIKLAEDHIGVYDQSIDLLTATKVSAEASKACFVNKLAILPTLNPVDIQVARAFGEARVAEIDALIATRIDQKLNALIAKRNGAQVELDDLIAATATTTSGSNIQNQSVDDIRAQIDKLESYINSVSGRTRTATKNAAEAQQELKDVEKEAKDIGKEILTFNNRCINFPQNFVLTN